MGGLGFGAAALLALVAWRIWIGSAEWLSVPLGAVAMMLLGYFDDRLRLGPLTKLVLSLVVGSVVVFALTVRAGSDVAWWLTLAAVIFYAGVVHAINLLDNMDGLAAGIALMAAMFLAWLNIPEAWPLDGDLVALSGALAGFLIWNRNPARLFMGDTGSLFIGAMLAGSALAHVFGGDGTPLSSALVVGLILLVPLFDTTFVLVLRRLAGRRATRGGTDHVSHRLASMGLSPRTAVSALYLLGLGGGVLAACVASWDPRAAAPLVVPFGLVVILFGLYLARVPAYDAEDFLALQKSSFAPFLKDLTFRWHAAEVLLDLVLIALCYYLAYNVRFADERFEVFVTSFTASLPIVLACKLGALYVSGLYARSWQTFGLQDIAAVIRGVGAGSVLSVLVVTYFYRFERFSRLVFVIDFVLLVGAILATRLSFRLISGEAQRRSKRAGRVLIYGAGASGQLLVRETRANPKWNLAAVGFLDDDPLKARSVVLGLPVLGHGNDLARVLDRVNADEVVLSSDFLDADAEARVRAVCAARSVRVRRLFVSLQ